MSSLDKITREEYGIFAPKSNRNAVLVFVGRLKKIEKRVVVGKNRDHLQDIFPMPEPVSAFQRNGFYNDSVDRATAAKNGIDALRAYFETQRGKFLSCLKDVTNFSKFDEFLDADYCVTEVQYIKAD